MSRPPDLPPCRKLESPVENPLCPLSVEVGDEHDTLESISPVWGQTT